MLYLGIDQHARQITISLRDENGDVIQARQVSTQSEKINAFFAELTREPTKTLSSVKLAKLQFGFLCNLALRASCTGLGGC